MSYTFSNDKIIAIASDGNGFIIQINKCESVINRGKDSNIYPNGFKIKGKIIEMKGNWSVGKKGASFEEIWYINKDKNRIRFHDSDLFYVKQ